MKFSPFVLAAVSLLLCLATAAGFLAQIISGNAAQMSGLFMQGGMALLWGAMALRFWTRGQVGRRLRRGHPHNT